MKTYQKAKYQFMLNSTLIQMSRDLKDLISQKYEGTGLDYQPQDIYRLEKADKDIAQSTSDRNSWEPALKKWAKTCGFKMTSRNQLLPEYYNE